MSAIAALMHSIARQKSPFLRTPSFIFCLPWGRPSSNHAKRCMNEKTIQCLPNPSQHIPIYLKQFPSYSNRKCKKSLFSRTAAHIFNAQCICISAFFAVTRCPSVCLSVTFVDHVKTNKDIFEIFSPSVVTPF